MRLVISAAFSVGMMAAGCSNNSQHGLPPATEWNASPVAASATTGSEAPLPPPPGMGKPRSAWRGGMSDPSNPHAGVDMSGDPHAGLDMSSDPSDPHAGLDMSRNPHGGGDNTMFGLAAPDPGRKIDPSQRVAGAITVDPKARDRAKPGTSVFVIVKRAGPDGAPSGPALAVDKLSWSKDGVPFELTEAQAMIAGTELSGDVVVMARYDQDSDALTKEPGDIIGQIRVKVPADNVKLRLDTILP